MNGRLKKISRSWVASLIPMMALFLGTPAHATIIHESATLGATGQVFGATVWGKQFLGSRFSLAEATQVTGIGGHIAADFTGNGIFGAIVNLSSPAALPAFPGRDIESFGLASTLFIPPRPSSDILAPLSVLLGPGHYGLVFGGADSAVAFFPFGATGTGVMPLNNTDLLGSSYFLFDGFRWVDGGLQNARFVVEGVSVGVPEPATFALMAVGLAALAFTRRRSNHA